MPFARNSSWRYTTGERFYALDPNCKKHIKIRKIYIVVDVRVFGVWVFCLGLRLVLSWYVNPGPRVASSMGAGMAFRDRNPKMFTANRSAYPRKQPRGLNLTHAEAKGSITKLPEERDGGQVVDINVTPSGHNHHN